MVQFIAKEVLETHLVRTSRTFALAVPLLPSGLRDMVTLAYLLFRAADTLEDAPTWSTAQRMSALSTFGELLDDRAGAEASVRAWLDAGVSEHAGYRALLGDLPRLLAELDGVPRAVRTHARRTALGMREMVPKSAGLASLADLQAYCYVVAGIVGELLTELFLDAEPSLGAVRSDLEAEAKDFGEGLQLVNILKDERDDASEGRRFLPASVGRSDVIAIAREDLVAGRRYVEALRRARAHPGVVAFTALPLELAEATLEALECHGPGLKLPRERVLAIWTRHREAAGR